MRVLVVGATGATGRLVVEQLLGAGIAVTAIVRSTARLKEVFTGDVIEQPNLKLVQASLLELSDKELAILVKGCDALISCLGHNLSFKGIYGQPRKLVTEATQRLCKAIEANRFEYEHFESGKESTPVKFILMNTTGNSNRDLSEKTTFAESCLLALIRLLLPPHVDNEAAADFLRTSIGQNNPAIEWLAVRPDTLLNEDRVSDYTLHPSPIRSPIFNAGKTSRINVAHFMSTLVQDDSLWQEWKGQMPVIYNKED